MKERKSAKSSVQEKQHQNGAHLSPFKLAKLLDPEASWDKVVTFGASGATPEVNKWLLMILPTNRNCVEKAEKHGRTDEDQLGDVLHWIRQIVALVCGLLWGAVPLVGGIWIVAFLLISSGIIYGYYALILKVDEEEFGGHGPLLQEGLFASITLFLLAWTLVYSLAHF
ncbi:Rab5-interacting protein [Tanacetum coccineum]|uniref:Rab5-interacting protein n=1 Tax=Tanacetum coccineum TaxID=301880 RepID=A0ABQ5HJ98_9ASTR